MSPRHNLSFCAWKTAWLLPEPLVSTCPSPHLWFLPAKQRILVQNFSLYGSQPWSAVFACQTASFGPELQVSMGPRPYLSFCACKTVWFAPEYQVYMFQHSSVVMSTHNSVLNTRINRLYWFQLSPVVLCMQISEIRTRNTRLHGSQPSCVGFGCKAATYGQE